MQIVPTLLAEKMEDLYEQGQVFRHLSKRTQVDVADGILVPNKTVGLSTILDYLIHNEEHYQDIVFDFHLMVQNWQQAVAQLQQVRLHLNINYILIHKAVFERKNISPFKIGIVYNPEDFVTKGDITHLSAVQIMTIHPGKQGSPFLPETLDKINLLRQNGFAGEILMDGGINEETIPVILKNISLPDTLCIGSYFTKTERPEEHLRKLKQLIQ